jgi:predicted xylose isomerase-like sugar epimerase
MIKIIKGSYGLRRGVSVEAIHAGTTIEIDKDKEARLVRLGVAVYVGNTGDENPEQQNTAETETTQDKDEVVDTFPEYNESMKLSDLKKVAEAYGIDASSMRTKKDVIEAIEAAQDLPAFDAVDSVE